MGKLANLNITQKDFQNTINFLEENSIYHIDSSITGNEGEPYIFEKKGIKVAVLNYVTKDTNPNLLNDAKVRPNWFYLKKVEEDIAKLKDKVDYIIVYPHWGGRMEGAKLPDRELIPIAHKIIDAGADIIIGHHSHTIQPYEIYRGKYIFYSLGNFCFSDLIFENRQLYLDRRRNFEGLIISVQVSKNSISINPYKISIINNRIVPLNSIVKRSNLGKNPLINKLWTPYLFYEKKIYFIISSLTYIGKSPISQVKNIKLKKILHHLGLKKQRN